MSQPSADGTENPLPFPASVIPFAMNDKRRRYAMRVLDMLANMTKEERLHFTKETIPAFYCAICGGFRGPVKGTERRCDCKTGVQG